MKLKNPHHKTSCISLRKDVVVSTARNNSQCNKVTKKIIKEWRMAIKYLQLRYFHLLDVDPLISDAG